MEENEQPQIKRGVKFWSYIWELVKIVVIASVIVLPIRYFLFQPFIVQGESMSPNFESGDYLIIDEISYRFGEPQRGDVIVFKYPLDNSQRFIKRVIGLPGETVAIKDGRVSVINTGQTFVLDEKYLPGNLKTGGDMQISVGTGEYFVLGDNRDYSYDSRRWGVVPRKDIIGKVFMRLLPIAAISFSQAPSY